MVGVREFFFGNFVVSFLKAGLFHHFDSVNINSNIISGRYFKYNMLVIIIFGAGQNSSRKFTTGCFNHRLSPNSDIKLS